MSELPLVQTTRLPKLSRRRSSIEQPRKLYSPHFGLFMRAPDVLLKMPNADASRRTTATSGAVFSTLKAFQAKRADVDAATSPLLHAIMLPDRLIMGYWHGNTNLACAQRRARRAASPCLGVLRGMAAQAA
jgi:hypothetical protein